MAEEAAKKSNEATEETAFEETFAHKALAKFKKIAIYLVIVIAIAVTISIISERQEAAKIDSWNEILKATFTAQTNLEEIAPAVAEATEKISGTPASQYGNILVMSSAGITYDKSKLELARKAAEDFIKTNPKNQFIDQVKLDYGTILFCLEDYQGALEQYTAVAGSDTVYLVHEAELYKGLTLEKLGKDEEAIQTYTTIIKQNQSDDSVSLKVFADYAAFAKTQLLDKKEMN